MGMDFQYLWCCCRKSLASRLKCPALKQNLRSYMKNISRVKNILFLKRSITRSLKMWKQRPKSQVWKSCHQYCILKKFEVLVCGDVEKLIKQRKTPDEHPVYYTTIEDTHDIISRGHIASGHGGRDRMLKHLCQHYNRSWWTLQYKPL